MQDYLNGLISEASLRTTPQDALVNCENDYTSIFGTFTNDYLKGISIMHTDENMNTPFAQDVVMHNIYADTSATQMAETYDYDDYDDYGETSSTLGFEC